jgi:hypothetical protein
MKKNLIDVLLELPVDATLRRFLLSHGLPLPTGFVWLDAPETSQRLVEMVKAWPGAARNRLSAIAVASIRLGNAAGKQAMFEAAASDPTALAGLTLCRSDVHRSFWLYVHHPKLFDRACDFSFWEHHEPKAQQYDLDIKREPNSSNTNLAALRRAISGFYQRELQCGDASVAHLAERIPGVFLLTMHIQDRASLQLEFKGKTLQRRLSHPDIHMMLEYSLRTGVVRALVPGHPKYQQMLVQAFCEHVLGVSVHQMRPTTLNLSRLRTGIHAPQALADGFSVVQLKSITLLSPDATLRIQCSAMHASQKRSVHELLTEKLPRLLKEDWTVVAAQINLYYPPEPGRTRSKVVTIEVTHKGRLNLYRFDIYLQAQLEGYLVSAGVLQKGQTLSAQDMALQGEK